MGMMTGTGPLSRQPAGTWNFDPPPPGSAVYIEPTPKRVRTALGAETVADSKRALLVSESGLQPVYYFPPEDVRLDLLEASSRRSHCPKKGDAIYYTVRAGERVAQDAAWSYPQPLAGARLLGGHIAFYFERMDRWFEEDEEIFGHAKDPYHRIDAYPSSRLVRVRLDGELLAESRRAVALFESNLPTRWYLPREDVRARLVPTDTVTTCAYKGKAAYYAVELDSGERIPDLVWSYPEPLRDGLAVKGLLCFFNERVDLELDGQVQQRPETAWSAGSQS
jgi:uncharacterized protein (DUF427 family)